MTSTEVLNANLAKSIAAESPRRKAHLAVQEAVEKVAKKTAAEKTTVKKNKAALAAVEQQVITVAEAAAENPAAVLKTLTKGRIKLTPENTEGLKTATTREELTPARLLSVARSLRKETEDTFDVQSIADEGAGYGARLRILKALRGTDKVLVKDAEPARLGRELKAAFKAKNAGDLALKGSAMIREADREAAKAKKADEKRSAEELKKALRAQPPIRDGKPILPAPPRMTKKQKAQKHAEELARFAREARHAEESEARMGYAKPRPDGALDVDMDAVCLLEDPANGIVLMRLEKPNSQGAICVYNNGSRVAAGVVPTEVLKTLRTLASTDMVRDVNQLLHPMTAGVTVTPVAERHLTAVLEHCKESIEMATKKAAAEKTKKFAAPKSAPTKGAKPAKEKKAAKSAKEEGTGLRKSSLFRLLNDTKATWGAFATQKGEIIAAFTKLGAVGKTATGVTRAQLIEALPDVSDKNISFYLSKWQPAGIVEKLPAAE